MSIKKQNLQPLLNNTNKRTPFLRKLPSGMQSFFRIEKKNVLDEWDAFYQQVSDPDFILNNPEIADDAVIILPSDIHAKLCFFLQFFGEFFMYNGDSNDHVYALACLDFFYDNYEHISGDETGPVFDREKLFFDAFK